MKTKHIFFSLLALLSVTACNDTPAVDEPVKPEDEEKYIQLDLSSAVTRAVWSDVDGIGNLGFCWEKTDINSVNSEELCLIVSNGEGTLPTWESTEVTPESESYSYTWCDIYPHADDSNYADFHTRRYYATADLADARFCFALAGKTQVEEDIDGKKHIGHMEMPSTFTQTANQDPSFLREYMYMYSTGEYNKNRTSLSFNHIPATLRIIITNTSSERKELQEVSFFAAENSVSMKREIASESSEVDLDWTSGQANISFSENAHTVITTVFEGEDTSLDVGETYTAYSMVLPLADSEALKDMLLNFKIKADDAEFLACEINAEKIAKANGGEIYNWVSGKSYTINLDLGDDVPVRGRVSLTKDIEIYSAIPGKYSLMYEDADGYALLENKEICTLEVDGFAHYEDLIDVNCAPRKAEKIGIYDSFGSRVGEIAISHMKASTKEPLYSVGMLSDVHCVSINTWYGITDFQNALKFFNRMKVEMVCICGDITNDGTEEELSIYRQVVDDYAQDIPVYTTSGNHDGKKELNEELWVKYTETPLTYDLPVVRSDGKTDHYLFLGMIRWSRDVPYRDADITWLKEKLEEYKDDRCFIITHLFFPDRAGNMNYIYPSSNYIQGYQLEQLEALCDAHPNSFWFSGHSHWKWELQKYQDRANIYRSYDKSGKADSGWCVHISSCANPNKSDGTNRDADPTESEGAILHVYEDHVLMQGIDFIEEKYFPIATYRLNTSTVE